MLFGNRSTVNMGRSANREGLLTARSHWFPRRLHVLVSTGVMVVLLLAFERSLEPFHMSECMKMTLEL